MGIMVSTSPVVNSVFDVAIWEAVVVKSKFDEDKREDDVPWVERT